MLNRTLGLSRGSLYHRISAPQLQPAFGSTAPLDHFEKTEAIDFAKFPKTDPKFDALKKLLLESKNQKEALQYLNVFFKAERLLKRNAVVKQGLEKNLSEEEIGFALEDAEFSMEEKALDTVNDLVHKIIEEADRPELIQALIRFHQKNAREEHQNTVSDPANAVLDDEVSPLILAVKYQRLKTIDTLLSAKADPYNEMYEGTTPLLAAAREENPDALLKLLDWGLDARKGNQDGTTPLDEAVDHSRPQNTRILLEWLDTVKQAQQHAKQRKAKLKVNTL